METETALEATIRTLAERLLAAEQTISELSAKLKGAETYVPSNFDLERQYL